jgi:plastocyanin
LGTEEAGLRAGLLISGLTRGCAPGTEQTPPVAPWRSRDDTDTGGILMHRRGITAVLLALALVSAPVAAAGSAVVVIKDTSTSFQPGTSTAALGTAVRWRNDDDEYHTATAALGGPVSWSIPLPAGSERSRTFLQAGTYPYFCAPHPEMKGAVRVRMKASARSIGLGGKVTLRMAMQGAPSGYRYRVQRRAPGGSWTTLRTTTSRTTTWVASTRGTWSFRARTERVSTGKVSGWSPVLSISVS